MVIPWPGQIWSANAAKTACLRGHPLSGRNLYVNTAGKRECRRCHVRRQVAYRRRKYLAMIRAEVDTRTG